jgi:Flp pilus assembly protein TadG
VKTTCDRQRGQATVELLLVLFVLLVLLFGAFGLGQGVALKHALDVATEKAARLLSIAPADFASADALVRAEVNASVLGGGYGSAVSLSLFDANSGNPLSEWDLASASFGYRFGVQASVPFLADVPLLNLTPRAITVAHYGLVERLTP